MEEQKTKESKKFSVITIILLTAIITTLLCITVYLVIDRYFSDEADKDNSVKVYTEPINSSSTTTTPTIEEYKVSDYVTINNITKNPRKFKTFDLKEITFKDLSAKLTQNFLDEQSLIITDMTNAKIDPDEEMYYDPIDSNLRTTVYSGVKDNVLYVSDRLSVRGNTEGATPIEDFIIQTDEIIYTAIDLENNRILSLGDILRKFDLNKLANNIFDEFFKAYTSSDYLYLDDNDIEVKELLKDKSSYVQMIFDDLSKVASNKKSPVKESAPNSWDENPFVGVYYENGQVYLMFSIYHIMKNYTGIATDPGGFIPIYEIQLEK